MIETVKASLWFYGISAVILTMIGGAVPLMRKWHDDHLHTFVSFSAGVLIAAAFLHLLPEAAARAAPKMLGFCILVSFLFLFILEKFVMIHPCEESHCDYHTMGLTAFFGMFIHTFFDGFALGASLFVQKLGPVVFFAIMAHKIPSSFALSSVLVKARWPKARIVLFIFLFGLAIPLGAVASTFLLHSIGDQATGIALALSLGTFLYISTSDFLPEVHRSLERRFQNLVGFFLGIALMSLAAFLEH